MEVEPTQENKNEQASLDSSTFLHRYMEDPYANGNKMKRLLRLDPNVNLQNDQGQTALMFGVTNGLLDGDIIDLILKKTDVKLKDSNRDTILHYFCKWGVQANIDYNLVFKKSDFFAENYKKEVPLHHIHNKEILLKLFVKYNEYTLFDSEKWPYPDGKSELYANLEDYCRNPSKLANKKIVIEKFCEKHEKSTIYPYPVPKDITEIISYAIKHANDADISNILKKSILPYSTKSINAQNILDAIDTDNKDIFDSVVRFCHDIETLVASSCSLILKSLSAAKHGDSFYKYLKGFLNKDADLTKIKDDSGCNTAHYLCKYNKIDLVKELLDSKDASVVAKLFTTADKNDCYPLAYAIDNGLPHFLEFFKDHFTSWCPDGFKNIKLATSKSDLLHHALDSKNVKIVKTLLDLDFPFNEDGNGLTPIHKIVLSFKTNLLTKVLSHLSQVKTSEEKESYINKQDDNELRALDYAVINEKESHFQLLRDNGADCDIAWAEKMVHYLVGERGLDKAEVEYLTEEFGIPYPQAPNIVFVNEVTRIKAKSESRSNKALPVQSFKQLTIYNIFIVHRAKEPFDAELSNKHTESDCTVVCHSIPLEYLSFDDLHHFTCLYNRRLVVASDQVDASLVELLSKLFDVSEDCTEYIERSTIDEIPLKFFHTKNTDDTDLPRPPDALLNVNEEIVKIKDEHREVLTKHQSKSGFFFLTKDFYLRQFYHVSLDPDTLDVGRQEALCQLGLLDIYYSWQGDEHYHRKIKARAEHAAAPITKSDILIKVTYKTTIESEPLNVSRFAVSVISSQLITDYMLLPDPAEDMLQFISRSDISLTFSSCKVGKVDVVKVNLVSSGQEDVIPCTTGMQRYILTLLRKVGISLKSKNVDVLLGIFCSKDTETLQFCSITGDSIPTKKTYSDLYAAEHEGIQPDVPTENWRLLQDTTAVTGDTLLIAADITAIEEAIGSLNKAKPLHVYYGNVGGCMLDKCTNKQLLYRICLMRKDYTLRQFIRDGQWSDNHRQAICHKIGLPVAETYTKLQNCLRLNWADILVLVIGIIITLAILIGCKLGGIDLSEFGVAGVATVPFIIALLNRCRMSYSHNPQYSTLPSIIPA